MSLSWEMIPASRHLFLVLCNPFHSVTCYEVRCASGSAVPGLGWAGLPRDEVLTRAAPGAAVGAGWNNAVCADLFAAFWLRDPQLPVYVPSTEEQRDPKLYASNVRKYMVSAVTASVVRGTRGTRGGVAVGWLRQRRLHLSSAPMRNWKMC